MYYFYLTSTGQAVLCTHRGSKSILILQVWVPLQGSWGARKKQGTCFTYCLRALPLAYRMIFGNSCRTECIWYAQEFFFSDQFASGLCVFRREIGKIAAAESDLLQGQELKLCTANWWNWSNMEKESNHEDIFQIKLFFLKKDNRNIISRRNRGRLMVSDFERKCCQGTIVPECQKQQALSELGTKEFPAHRGPIPSPPAVISSGKFIPALRVVGVEPELLKEHWLFQQLRCHQEKENLSRRMISCL